MGEIINRLFLSLGVEEDGLAGSTEIGTKGGYLEMSSSASFLEGDDEANIIF